MKDSPRLRRLRYLHRQKKYNKKNAPQIAGYQKEYGKTHRDELNRYAINRYHKIRKTVINKFSNGDPKCSCNGCDEKAFKNLVVEHVNGKKIHGHDGMSNPTYYLKLLRTNPKGIKISCQRCNASKRDGQVCRIHNSGFA